MATDGQPTTKYTRLAGTFYTDDTPPTAAEMGRPLEEGDFYYDNESPTNHICVYNGSTWDCVALNVAGTAATSTSTSTTTTTTTTTSTSTSTTAT